MASEEDLLKDMGLDIETPDTGCCGMAGAFGFESGEHYDVAQACGERVLLLAVRDADEATIIVADGFSCSEMVRQSTDRVPLHFAQVVQMALREGGKGTPGRRPEQEFIHADVPLVERVKTVALAAATVGAVAASVWWFAKRRR